jgi:cell division initiation protein
MSSITPVEVRHAQLGRALLGYGRRATDNLLESIAQSYEQTWWERADLRDEVERLQQELARFRDMERLLRDTLLSAERAADDLRAQGRREYDMLIQEARLKSREIVMEAEGERERIRSDIRNLRAARSDLRASYRAFLQAALERLDSELEEPGSTPPERPLAPAAAVVAEVSQRRPLEEPAAPLDDGDRDPAEDTEAPTHAA